MERDQVETVNSAREQRTENEIAEQANLTSIPMHRGLQPFTTPIYPNRRVSESISSPADEVVHVRKGVRSDPIGKEQGLSSDGPLDDGIGPDLTPTRQPSFWMSPSGASESNEPFPLRIRTFGRVENDNLSASLSGSISQPSSWAKFHDVDGSSSPETSPEQRVRDRFSRLCSPREKHYNTPARQSDSFRSSPESATGLNDGSPPTLGETRGQYDQTPLFLCNHDNTKEFSSPHGKDPFGSVEIGTATMQSRKHGDSAHIGNNMSTTRHGARSHTSQGIPIHKLRLLLGESASILEEAHHVERGSQAEHEQLVEELQFYKERIVQLEGQVAALTFCLDEERQKTSTLISHSRSATCPKPARFEIPAWRSPLMNPSRQEKLSPDTPGSASMPSMTMSPDPFSPYQHASPHMAASRNADGHAYLPGHLARLFDPCGRPRPAPGLTAVRPVETTVFPSTYQGEHHDAEQAYLTGLRLNLPGFDQAALPSSIPVSPGQEPVQVVPGTNEQIPGEEHYRGKGATVHSWCGAEMCSPASAATTDPCFASATGHSTIAGHELRDERQRKCPGSDNATPPDVLVSRALGVHSQDASISLQQQLKTATPARKTAIIRAIAPQLLRLAVDRHGNFLVQRAIGVEPQLAWRLQGYFVTLSLSQFGCHVVQKLLDHEEDLRKVIVEELLSDQVMQTLTCRHSVHIWQKVLQLQWSDADVRTKIFLVINDTLWGKWADTAMLETGSIICQNIFESADANEKRDCMMDIIDRLCECAQNQWGVWVVQHIIEHGEPEAKQAALLKLLSDAVETTLSAYGHKAIMSALKTKDPTFIAQYIKILCEKGDATRTTPTVAGTSSGTTVPARRSPLVDVSTSPHGLQILSQLFTSVTDEQRILILKTVRKNGVFLKGSKAGMRVNQLCERARAYQGY